MEDTVTMERFRGKARQTKNEPVVTISPEQKSIHLNKEAKELVDGKWVNYFVSDDEEMVGIKPVSGGDVDENSYKLSNNHIAFGGVWNTLGLSTDRKWLIDAEWDEDHEMLVFSVFDIHASEE